jgi:hypothetical protein
MDLCWFSYLPKGVSVSQIYIEPCLHQKYDPNKAVVIEKSNDYISMQITTQESITTYMLA